MNNGSGQLLNELTFINLRRGCNKMNRVQAFKILKIGHGSWTATLRTLHAVLASVKCHFFSSEIKFYFPLILSEFNY